MATPSDELRPVTVLFADLVGSTALGERLTAAEVKALIGECVTRMAIAVEEFGGFVQAYMGDGICAYFGVPTTHEDDPERAALAALRIVDVVGTYGRDVEAAWGIEGFAVRVGINSGQTAVGTVGTGHHPVALGDTTNVAARLESSAAPGTVLIGGETARLLKGRFALESMGSSPVKGRAEPVPAWRLLGASERSARGETPLVGREAEMDELRGVVNELADGRGQVLLILGEAGIGKTRMLAEVGELARSVGLTALSGACRSYGAGVYAPYAAILRSWLGIDESAPGVAVRMRLRANLSDLDSLSEGVQAALEGVLGLAPRADRSRPSAEQSDPILDGYCAWVEALASKGPVVLAVDDVHWADEITRTLAEALLDATDSAPLLVAFAMRPEEGSGPGSEAVKLRTRVITQFAHRAREVLLRPLSEAAGRQLADLLIPPGALDEATKHGLVTQAEGNALYLEELLKSVAQRGPRDSPATWTISLRDLLPSSLEGLFLARVDRLTPSARMLLQQAAAIGREFPVAILERLPGDSHVRDDLAVLLRADLIRELRRYPEFVCTFRHGLLQETVMSTLTPDRVRRLYGQVGKAYEEVYADSLEARLEQAAFYFYRSDEPARALPYLERAAQAALAAGAPSNAKRLLTRAEKLATALADDATRARVADQLSALSGALADSNPSMQR